MGLVGNYWVKGSFYPEYKTKITDHFRTSCFAISRKMALQLCFPDSFETKWDCYRFEWLDKDMNLTSQVRRAGFNMQPVCGDWRRSWVDTNEYVWDVGCLHMQSLDPRCRKDYWVQYEAQFSEKP